MAKRTCNPTSGSIGPETYLVGKNGQVVRNRVKPRNLRTAAQVIQRSILAAVSARWRTLTDAGRLAWANAAAAVHSKARLGMSGILSGQQLFCKLNATLQTFGQDATDLPTAQPTFPDLAVTSFTATAPAGGPLLSLGCPTNPGQNTVIRAAKPQSAGVTRAPRRRSLARVRRRRLAWRISRPYTWTSSAQSPRQAYLRQRQHATDGWETIPVPFTSVVPAST